MERTEEVPGRPLPAVDEASLAEHPFEEPFVAPAPPAAAQVPKAPGPPRRRRMTRRVHLHAHLDEAGVEGIEVELASSPLSFSG